MDKKRAIGRYWASGAALGLAIGLLIGEYLSRTFALILGVVFLLISIGYYVTGGKEGKKLVKK